MDRFSREVDSYEHSLSILELIYEYDSFLDNLEVICDMGCGVGQEVKWWATLETRDDPPEPRNYKVYAVDIKDRLDPDVRALPNVIPIERNFEESIIPVSVDLMWCHDAFQYAIDPIGTLKTWNSQMSQNGMLVMSVPLTVTLMNNRPTGKVYDHMYYCHTLPNLIYMLAVNGFDCRDAYFMKSPNSNWLHLAVYKSTDPMDPRTTRLFDLADKNLLHDSVVYSLNKYGHLRQDDIIYPWLDKDFHQFMV